MADNAGRTSFNREKKILFHYKINASFIAGTIRKLHIITSLFLPTLINSNFGP